MNDTKDTILDSPEELGVWLDVRNIKLLSLAGLHGHSYDIKDTFKDHFTKIKIDGNSYELISSKQCINCLSESIRVNKHHSCRIKIYWSNAFQRYLISVRLDAKHESKNWYAPIQEWEELSFENQDKLIDIVKDKLKVLESVVGKVEKLVRDSSCG